MMQDHPIELLDRSLAAAAAHLSRLGLVLLAVLALLGLVWLGVMRPAEAAGRLSVPALAPAPLIAVPTISAATLAAPAPADEVQAPSEGLPLPSSVSVCQLNIDTAAPDPLAAVCVPPRATNAPTAQ